MSISTLIMIRKYTPMYMSIVVQEFMAVLLATRHVVLERQLLTAFYLSNFGHVHVVGFCQIREVTQNVFKQQRRLAWLLHSSLVLLLELAH